MVEKTARIVDDWPDWKMIGLVGRRGF